MCVNMYLHVNEYACVAHLSVRNACVSVCLCTWMGESGCACAQGVIGVFLSFA